MAYQRVPETAQVKMIFDTIGIEISNLYYARKVGGYSQSDLDQLAIAIDNNVAPGLKAIMATGDQYLRTEVRGLDSEYDLTAVDNFSAGYGSITSFPLPPNFSFVMTQRSGFTGAASSGRVYIAPICRDARDLSGGNTDKINVSYANAYQAAIDSVRSQIENIGAWDAVLVSRFHNGSKRTEAITTKWLTTLYRNRYIRTRRDRKAN